MSKKLSALQFPRDDETKFHQALMSEVNVWLQSKGDHHYADSVLWLRIILLIGLCIGSYALVVTQSHRAIFITSYVVFIMAAMLLNIIAHHDACHNTLFRRPIWNRLLSRLVTLPLGADPDYWRVRHTEYHHHYANIEDYDLDTEENGILRQTPFQRWKPHMRWQYLYWPLIAAMSLPYIAWVFDWSDRLGKTALVHNPVLKGRWGWLIFLLSKIGHFTLALIVPYWAAQLHGISGYTVLLTYLLTQMFASLVVVLLLLGTHWAQAKFYQAPENSQMSHGWYRHNFATSCDWHAPAWLSPWFGGLNLHLTHHLFPGWNHRHYPALARIVERLAAEYGYPYRAVPYSEVFRYQQIFLKKMARQQDDDCIG